MHYNINTSHLYSYAKADIYKIPWNYPETNCFGAFLLSTLPPLGILLNFKTLNNIYNIYYPRLHLPWDLHL